MLIIICFAGASVTLKADGDLKIGYRISASFLIYFSFFHPVNAAKEESGLKQSFCRTLTARGRLNHFHVWKSHIFSTRNWNCFRELRKFLLDGMFFIKIHFNVYVIKASAVGVSLLHATHLKKQHVSCSLILRILVRILLRILAWILVRILFRILPLDLFRTCL